MTSRGPLCPRASCTSSSFSCWASSASSERSRSRSPARSIRTRAAAGAPATDHAAHDPSRSP
eukprot:5535707-Alexandrium_andersonii.AAC.1